MLWKTFAHRFHDYFFDAHNGLNKFISTLSDPLKSKTYSKSLAFVFKGPFRLAHAEFFLQFLRGSKIFSSAIKITLILLDDDGSSLVDQGIDHVEIVSFSRCSLFDKLNNYYKLCVEKSFHHISWIACVQSLTLFMGKKLAPVQSYWSMKYHSIIMDSLDKYAGLGFGGDTFMFDDIEWFRGRAFPDLTIPILSRQRISQLRNKNSIPDGVILAGCFVRAEKLNNPEFWEFVKHLLSTHRHLHFAIASQNLPPIASNYLSLDVFRSKFHNLGWVNTKEWCQCLDIYIDSFPRGSCLTALEAIKANVPILMFDTEHNRESSAPALFIVCQQ